MAVEQYANTAQDTLNGAINDSVTSVTLNDASEFPAIGDFRVLVDNEIMLGTARSGNVLTVTRGAESTTAAAHSDSATATGIVTAAALVAHADRFSAFVRRSEIKVADLTWDNQVSATSTEDAGVVTISHADPGGSVNDLKVLHKTAPSAPFTMTCMVWSQGHGGTLNGAGIYLRQASDGKLTGIQLAQNDDLFVQKWTNTTTFSALYITAINNFWRNLGKPVFLRLRDDNTTRHYEVSADGFKWDSLHTVGRTDFMTGDQVGIGLNTNGGGGGRVRVATFWDLDLT